MNVDFGNYAKFCILLTGFVSKLILTISYATATACSARRNKRFGSFCCWILNVLFKFVKRYKCSTFRRFGRFQIKLRIRVPMKEIQLKSKRREDKG